MRRREGRGRLRRGGHRGGRHGGGRQLQRVAAAATAAAPAATAATANAAAAAAPAPAATAATAPSAVAAAAVSATCTTARNGSNGVCRGSAAVWGAGAAARGAVGWPRASHRRLHRRRPLYRRRRSPWLWQQRRREQIPRGNTDNTEEKDPKGRPPERT